MNARNVSVGQVRNRVAVEVLPIKQTPEREKRSEFKRFELLEVFESLPGGPVRARP